MNLEIKETNAGWTYNISEERMLAWGDNFESAEKAIEAGSKRLLELSLKEQTFDFGNGPVPAHQHKNGGGWVADTAHVDSSASVGPAARVYGSAQVFDNAKILNDAKVYEYAIVKRNAVIRNSAQVYGNARVSGNAEVAEFAHIFGRSCLCGHVRIYGRIRFNDTSLFGENK